MSIHEEEEIKKEFQLERVILFTDAVFAIIMTIMVLEIKLPDEIGKLGEKAIDHAFKQVGFKLSAYCITFALVARFWLNHLKLFRYLKDYDSKLLVLNLLFLFSITLFPFAVSLITSQISPQLPNFTLVMAIYVSVIYSSIFFQSLISYYLIKNRAQLCINTTLLEDTLKWKIARLNLFLGPVLIGAVFVFYYLQTPYYFPIFTVGGYGAILGRLHKRYYPASDNGPWIVQLYRYIKPVAKNKKTKVPIKKPKN